MNPIVDYHMHTPLCRHAEGQPEEYVERALSIGLQEIGFSDHAPLVANHIPDVCMLDEELPLYHRMIEDVQARFHDKLTIRMALEADYIPGFEKQTQTLLSGYPYDYVIGSVHFIEDWCFDNPADMAHWQEVNVDEIYRRYYSLLRQAAQSRLFDIMGHVDLVKKFGHRPQKDISSEIRKTAMVFKENGVGIEINTAGLRKPVQEIYPSLDSLKIYRQAGVLLTFGSDAHRPFEVGMHYDRARELALAAGYSEYVLFAARKIIRTVKL